MNVPFYVYRPDDPSGKILRTGTCPRKVLVLQARPGELVKEGVADDLTQKIVGHKLAKKTPAEVVASRPPKPDPKKKRVSREDFDALVLRLAAVEEKLKLK